MLLAKVYGALGAVPALAVEGHHAALAEILPSGKLVKKILDQLQQDPQRFTDTDLGSLVRRFSADDLAQPSIKHGLRLCGGSAPASDMLDVRMLFSALVDADFVETEAHFSGDAEQPRQPRDAGPTLELDRAIVRLETCVRSLRQDRACPMNSVRERLYSACVRAAEQQPTGLFTLSAPTGAGKTLAMLAFALFHARMHHLRRVVLVMPFLNIIEQTARIYREIFSVEHGFHPLSVLEHHSLANEGTPDSADGMNESARLLAENWDAPIILTTNVQCLESMMAHRPSRCRKLHRLARSVILFDEVQTLPPKLAKVTLATLSRLADPDGPYGSTVLFATATQPAFDVLHNEVTRLAPSGWRPREIVPQAEELFTTAADRVGIHWRHEEPVELETLADELAEHPRVLCIVNLKRHAIELAKRLRDRCDKQVLHLSTNMCPAHRTDVLNKVRRRLAEARPVQLIATQCVEAGVDLDFPLVYRALAPLEAVSQAAGRCNRHGSSERGHVVVFKPQDDRSLYPPGYREGVDATETYLNLLRKETDLDTTDVINNPSRLQAYFRHFYGLSGRDRGQMEDERAVLSAVESGIFEDVANEYRLIREDAISILVPYSSEHFERLSRAVNGPARLRGSDWRRWTRMASNHSVNLFRPSLRDGIWNLLLGVRGALTDNARDTWFVANDTELYDQDLLGLLSPETESCWIT